ncbi:DNA excision repair protein ERCC-6-like [Sardina pilchardus]|uniref:DNA excision repair protein ERCC-6-like n=1 Tax=Sardina pilchardus TaxID=27697 RepID=UPI002E14D384
MDDSPEDRRSEVDVLQDISHNFSKSMSIAPADLDTYTRKAKEAFKQGNPATSLEILKEAYKHYPDEKIKGRIKKLQEFINQMDVQSSDDEDEFIDVNNSGLMLNKRIYDNLYDHQKQGVAFLYGLHRDGRTGGVLADDMGLGKTIQVISFLCGMYDSELLQNCLLVMPTTLITNWVREFQKWVPGMRVREFHGTSKAVRSKNLRKVQVKGGVLITSYQMVMNNWELLSSIDGREFYWDYVILDEAHKIKTSSTKTAKSMHAVLAKHRVLLTGTPVQNNLREMWSLFDFACQGSLLGTYKTFKTQYENPITRAREKDATPGEKVLGFKMSENLMEIISPYFLRRTKTEVLKNDNDDQRSSEVDDQPTPTGDGGLEVPSLPEKNDLIVWTYLSPVQEQIYRMFISLDHIKEVLMTTRSPLAELTIIKKLCDHPRLLSDKAASELGLLGGQDHALPDIENSSGANSIDHVSDETLISESGKLGFLIELLERLREEGNRTLVFSRSVKMLNIIQRILKNKGFKIVRIDGTVTDLSEREKRIGRFQNDPSISVFLLTTQVGGVGLTLTSANRVVIFDPSWNPATDSQAVDRAYRIGQTRNVIVYRLITCGTVEEKIYRRQVFKDSLIRQTTGDNKNPFRYFSKQDLKELFKLEDTHSSTTQLQLEQLHSKQQSGDPDLMEHIAYLYTKKMFGVSHHDLLFCVQPTEDDVEDHEEHEYIEKRVLTAENLMKVESQIQKDLKDFELQHTEPRSLQQPVRRGRQESDKQRHEDLDQSVQEFTAEEPVVVLDESPESPESPNLSVANEVVLELDSSRTEEMESLQRNSTMGDANDIICLDDDETNVVVKQEQKSFTVGDDEDYMAGGRNSTMGDANDIICLDDDETNVVVKQERKSFTVGDDEDYKAGGRKSLVINKSFEGNSSLAKGDTTTPVNDEVNMSTDFTENHLIVEDEDVSFVESKRVSLAYCEQERDITTVDDEADMSTEYLEEDQVMSEEEDHVATRKKKAFVINSSDDEGDDDDDDEGSVRADGTGNLSSLGKSDMSHKPDSSGGVEYQLLSDEEDDVVKKKKSCFLILSSDEEGDDEEEGERSKADCVSSPGNSRLDETNNGPDTSEHAKDKLEIQKEADISSGENKSAFLTYSSEEEEEEEEDGKSMDRQSSKTASYTSSTPGNSRLTDSNGITSGDDNANMSAFMEDQLISDKEDSVIITKKKRAFVTYSSEEEEGEEGDGSDVCDGSRENFQFTSSLMSVSGVGDRSYSSVASRRSLVDNLMEKFEDILMDEDETSEEMTDSDKENDMFCTLDQSG